MSQDAAADVTERQLLQSIVEVERQVYAAAASSVFTVSPDTGELVFAAVAGEGEEGLVGTRFPAGTGIAGWVVASCEPIIVDDVGGACRNESCGERGGYGMGTQVDYPFTARRTIRYMPLILKSSQYAGAVKEHASHPVGTPSPAEQP